MAFFSAETENIEIISQNILANRYYTTEINNGCITLGANSRDRMICWYIKDGEITIACMGYDQNFRISWENGIATYGLFPSEGNYNWYAMICKFD